MRGTTSTTQSCLRNSKCANRFNRHNRYYPNTAEHRRHDGSWCSEKSWRHGELAGCQLSTKAGMRAERVVLDSNVV